MARILKVKRNGTVIRDYTGEETGGGLDARANEGRTAVTYRAPTLGELLKNFSGAMSRFAAGGFRTVDRETFDERLSVCRQCPLWEEDARAGLGRCRHPKCGCTKFKHWLRSEKCPADKW